MIALSLRWAQRARDKYRDREPIIFRGDLVIDENRHGHHPAWVAATGLQINDTRAYGESWRNYFFKRSAKRNA